MQIFAQAMVAPTRKTPLLVLLLVGATSLAQAPAAKVVGTVKSVSGNSVVITTDGGQEISVTFAGSARIIEAAPGQADLKNATPIHASDIQPGDRIFAKGQAGENGALVASSALVMKKTEIAQKQQTERDEWRRGIGGIVKSVDAGASTITVANSLLASGKPIVVHVTPQTSIKRYAPDSIKFDAAQPGTLDQIKPGEQLRARGTKNEDGTEFNAQAIVSGSFRDIAGTVVSTDAGNNSVTVMDLATKNPVVIRVSNDSELRKIPPQFAARIAMRLKGRTTDAASGDPKPASEGAKAGAAQSGNSRDQSGDNRGGPGRGGAADFQQMLSRMPSFSISDLNKGDAVMLVATEGSGSSQPTAIKMIAGVEPILTASPNGASASMILSPWNLSAGEAPGGDTQ